MSAPAAAGLLRGWSRRHLVVALTFFACIVAYTDRVNISVAVVAMAEQYHWTPVEKGRILSAFFVGYMLFMFASGVLAAKIGGKLVLGWSVLAWSVFTLLTPLAAGYSMPALLAARIGMGIGEAAMFPAAYEVFARWVPAPERARAAAGMLSGIPVGTVVGLAGSGWLVQHASWPMAFYVFGGIGLVWVVVWFLEVKNDPNDDPRVGPEERALLAGSSSGTEKLSFKSVCQVLFNAPVAAIAVAHFAVTWYLYMLLSWLPSYFRDVQHLSIASAGLYSASPWITMFIASNTAAVVADRMIANGQPVARTRKLIQCGSLVATGGLLLLLEFASTPLIAVSLLCAATAALGCSWAGFAPGMLDVAPRNGAVVYGFSNTFGTIPGIVGVYVTGWLVQATGHFSAAFALSAGVGALAAVLFATFFAVRSETAASVARAQSSA